MKKLESARNTAHGDEFDFAAFSHTAKFSEAPGPGNRPFWGPGRLLGRFSKDFRSIYKQRDATETLPTQIAGEGA